VERFVNESQGRGGLVRYALYMGWELRYLEQVLEMAWELGKCSMVWGMVV